MAGKSKDSHDSRVVKLALVGGESKPTGPNWDWKAYPVERRLDYGIKGPDTFS